ncbi:MAG: hypothetical protein IRZ16_18035 [Myxococcaceae bacterium]|nr:hypothetical protein [Myxococcaceae bacterium]
MTRLPVLPERVVAEPGSTDARQTFIRTAHGELRIVGRCAESSEGAGAELSLAFDDLRVSIGLKPGQTPEQSALLLARVLPPGYRLIATPRGDEVICELVRDVRPAVAPDAPPKVPPRTATPLATLLAQPLAAR